MYLRLQSGQTIDDIPSQLLDDCAQLVKANSIKGNKMNNVRIVYTMWDNLKKTGDMDVGQVGFKDNKQVRYVTVEKRINEIMNRLEKTKIGIYVMLSSSEQTTVGGVIFLGGQALG